MFLFYSSGQGKHKLFMSCVLKSSQKEPPPHFFNLGDRDRAKTWLLPAICQELYIYYFISFHNDSDE